jgi:hypothetical protein
MVDALPQAPPVGRASEVLQGKAVKPPRSAFVFTPPLVFTPEA